LRLGKLPTADDERVLFPPADVDVDGEKRREIDAWVDEHKTKRPALVLDCFMWAGLGVSAAAHAMGG